MPSPSSLPDDIDALKALLRQRDGEVQQLRDTVSTLEQALSIRTLEIEQLKLQLAKLKRMQFGRKSEKLDRKIEQIETRLEDLLAEEGEAEEKQPELAVARQKSVRQPLPEHLPREDRVLEPEDQACPACGGNLKPLGEDVSEQLEIIDTAFKVIRHVRRKKACACCDCIVQAPAPSRTIERGIAGPGLLAHIAVSKFADHQPLYRQAVIGERKGVELDRSTMARWLGICGALVRPLVDALQRYVLVPGKVHTDDTPMPVLSPGNGQTKTGRLWVYVRDDRRSGSIAAPAVWFAYSGNRQGLNPQTHLAGFSGALQADAFAGYVAAEFMLRRRARVRISPLAVDSCPHIKSGPRFKAASETPSTKAVWPHDVALREVQRYRRWQAPSLSSPGLPQRRYVSCPGTHVPARLGSY